MNKDGPIIFTEPKTVVACIPVDLAPNFPKIATYATYEKVKCPGCGHMMWLGDRGRTMVEHGADMRCMVCLTLLARDAGLSVENLHIETLTDPKAGSA